MFVQFYLPVTVALSEKLTISIVDGSLRGFKHTNVRGLVFVVCPILLLCR